MKERWLSRPNNHLLKEQRHEHIELLRLRRILINQNYFDLFYNLDSKHYLLKISKFKLLNLFLSMHQPILVDRLNSSYALNVDQDLFAYLK